MKRLAERTATVTSDAASVSYNVHLVQRIRGVDKKVAAILTRNIALPFVPFRGLTIQTSEGSEFVLANPSILWDERTSRFVVRLEDDEELLSPGEEGRTLQDVVAGYVEDGWAREED
jgi:hypothetical protein